VPATRVTRLEWAHFNASLASLTGVGPAQCFNQEADANRRMPKLGNFMASRRLNKLRDEWLE
jgi:hypothetical protein